MGNHLMTGEYRPSPRRPAGSNGRSTVAPAQSWSASVKNAMVFILEDDAAMREALLNLMESVGLESKAFASTAELWSMKLPDVASCFVVDIRLPGLSGLDFQAHLAEANIRIPIIFMTGHADIPMTVRAMKAGAVDFLSNPFRDQEILDAVTRAIELDKKRLDKDQRSLDIFARFETLSQREREVMELVTAGSMNKQAAGKIGVAISTVKIYRAQVMKKMGAKSLADLVRMAELVRLASAYRPTLWSALDKPK